MTSVWLVTNGGSGEDGDEWLLDSVHATEASAKTEAESNEWHREVEEWELEGSILSDEEREVLSRAADDAAYRAMERTEKVIRGLLERTGNYSD